MTFCISRSKVLIFTVIIENRGEHMLRMCLDTDVPDWMKYGLIFDPVQIFIKCQTETWLRLRKENTSMWTIKMCSCLFFIIYLFYFFCLSLLIHCLGVVFLPHSFPSHHHKPCLWLHWRSKDIFCPYLSRLTSTPLTVFLCHPLTSVIKTKAIIYTLGPAGHFSV